MEAQEPPIPHLNQKKGKPKLFVVVLIVTLLGCLFWVLLALGLSMMLGDNPNHMGKHYHEGATQ